MKIQNAGYRQQNLAARCEHVGCSKWAQEVIGEGEEDRNDMRDKRPHACCAHRHCIAR